MENIRRRDDWLVAPGTLSAAAFVGPLRFERDGPGNHNRALTCQGDITAIGSARARDRIDARLCLRAEQSGNARIQR